MGRVKPKIYVTCLKVILEELDKTGHFASSLFITTMLYTQLSPKSHAQVPILPASSLLSSMMPDTQGSSLNSEQYQKK